MSDPEKEMIDAAANVVLQPLANVVGNVLDVLGGNWIEDVSKRQQERFRARRETTGRKAMAIIKDRGVEEPIEPNEADLESLAEFAQAETREALQDLWARLLASMLDPKRAPGFRSEFIEIVKQLEPLDVVVLPELNSSAQMPPNRRTAIAEKLGRKEDEIELSMRNLLRLDLVWQNSIQSVGMGAQATPAQPFATALGKQLLAAIAP